MNLVETTINADGLHVNDFPATEHREAVRAFTVVNQKGLQHLAEILQANVARSPRSLPKPCRINIRYESHNEREGDTCSLYVSVGVNTETQRTATVRVLETLIIGPDYIARLRPFEFRDFTERYGATLSKHEDTFQVFQFQAPSENILDLKKQELSDMYQNMQLVEAGKATMVLRANSELLGVDVDSITHLSKGQVTQKISEFVRGQEYVSQGHAYLVLFGWGAWKSFTYTGALITAY